MQIDKINYYEHLGEPNEWILEDFSLGQINLIVGRNAVGKTRTINVLSGLARLLAESKQIIWNDGNYDVEFKHDDHFINYKLEYKNRSIEKEELVIDDFTYLDRGNDGVGEIFFSEEKRSLKFQTPTNELAAFARRDAIQHPYLNQLYEWGSKLVLFRFGTNMGQDRLILRLKTGKDIEVNLKDDNVIDALILGKEKYGDEFADQVKTDLQKIGYDIGNIDIGSPNDIHFESAPPANPLAIFVQENDTKTKIYQHLLSQGMFRSVSLVIQLNYFLSTNSSGTILIDDIGEGIDFDRASSLIELLINKVKNTKYQLIMTTNDRFTMNNVPIDYWSILNRDGGKCRSYNYKNSKEIFDEFKLTGLNNFDLFSSNFYRKSTIN
jgi:energy-coupling factor transporter ATP-binding protein EcfA2